MKRLLLPVVLAATMAMLLWPVAARGGPISSSAVTRIYSEPAAGYGFFSAAIASARHNIDLSMYELEDPVIEAELVHRAKAGVRVRVLLNSAYGRSENAPAANVLRDGGVHVTWAPRGQIFHAKYLVIDDARVYIGTGNLVRYYYSSTRDFWVLDQVSGDVADVEATFSSDVAGAARPPAPHGGLVWSPGSAGVLEALIGSARSTLLVENEEMNNEGIEQALDAAAARGVRVSVAMTRDPSYLSALTSLAQHGVHVSLMSPPQVYVHAKVICADCSTTSGALFVGSENFSTSSLSYNRELGVITRSLVAIDSVRPTVLLDEASGTHLAP